MLGQGLFDEPSACIRDYNRCTKFGRQDQKQACQQFLLEWTNDTRRAEKDADELLPEFRDWLYGEPSPVDDPTREECLAEAFGRRGFAVESHTSHHDFLAAQSPELQAEELRRSKQRLEEELGRGVEHLAYPFGFPGCFDEVTKRAAREARYTAAFEMGDRYAGSARDPYEIPRFGISRAMPAWRLELILSGLFF